MEASSPQPSSTDRASTKPHHHEATSPLFASDREGDAAEELCEDRGAPTDAGDDGEASGKSDGSVSDAHSSCDDFFLGAVRQAFSADGAVAAPEAAPVPRLYRLERRETAPPPQSSPPRRARGPRQKSVSSPSVFASGRRTGRMRRGRDGHLTASVSSAPLPVVPAAPEGTDARFEDAPSDVGERGRPARSVSPRPSPSGERPSRPRSRRFALFSPARRYRRKTSAISVMEDQIFVPPPEENSAFFGSALSLLWGRGVDFVIWTNESSFFRLSLLFLVGYYALVCVFAGILVQLDGDGRCGLDADGIWNARQEYELAFELSWTTFTTVGYGRVSPSGYEYGCFDVRVLCASFAFLGLLFNSLSAAIFFSKLEKYLTRTVITFSSSVCLQYGRQSNSRRGSEFVYGQFMRRSDPASASSPGMSYGRKRFSTSSGPGDFGANNASSKKFSKSTSLAIDDSQDNDNGDAGGAEKNGPDLALQAAEMSRRLPYPFLEFRIVNEHANYRRREIRNAHVSAMVQLTPGDAEDMMDRKLSTAQVLREYVTPAPSQHSSPTKDISRKTLSGSGSLDDLLDASKSRQKQQKAKRMTIKLFTTVSVQEEDSGTGKQASPEGRIYFPLALEPSSHPYFKRVWYIRHVLNHRSPMLKPSVRSKILNGWDPSLCTYQDIYASLVDFQRVRITFKGNSAVNNCNIYTQKVYTKHDLFVGWQFGNIFYKRETSWRWRKRRRRSGESGQRGDWNENDIDDGDLVLDKRLIHDIIPQKGGGNEPIEY